MEASGVEGRPLSRCSETGICLGIFSSLSVFWVSGSGKEFRCVSGALWVFFGVLGELQRCVLVCLCSEPGTNRKRVMVDGDPPK